MSLRMRCEEQTYTHLPRHLAPYPDLLCRRQASQRTSPTSDSAGGVAHLEQYLELVTQPWNRT